MRWLISTLLLVATACPVCAAPAEAQADIAKVKAYLAKTYPGKKWQIGPTRLDTPEIRQVFAGQRFFVIRSSPPLPPGAPLPELIAAFQKKMADYRKTALNATVRLDAKGKIDEIRKATDLNAGMKPVTTEKEAQVVAAAAFTVNPSGTPGLAKVRADQVKVERVRGFLTAMVLVPNVMRGGVTFDKEGKLSTVAVKATPRFPPAVPPSAPPGLPRRER